MNIYLIKDTEKERCRVMYMYIVQSILNVIGTRIHAHATQYAVHAFIRKYAKKTLRCVKYLKHTPGTR